MCRLRPHSKPLKAAPKTLHFFGLFINTCITVQYISNTFLCVTVNIVSLICVIRSRNIHSLLYVSSLCLGHQEFRESADPSAAALPSWRRGHEDLPHLVWVSGLAGLQELHPPHYPPGNGHPPARRQPQQSIGYHTCIHTLQALLYRSRRLKPHRTSFHITSSFIAMSPRLWNEKRRASEKHFKPCLLSHLCTPGLVWMFGLSVLEIMLDADPLILMLDRCGREGGYRRCSNIRQEVCLKHTDALTYL